MIKRIFIILCILTICINSCASKYIPKTVSNDNTVDSEYSYITNDSAFEVNNLLNKILDEKYDDIVRRYSEEEIEAINQALQEGGGTGSVPRRGAGSLQASLLDVAGNSFILNKECFAQKSDESWTGKGKFIGEEKYYFEIPEYKSELFEKRTTSLGTIPFPYKQSLQKLYFDTAKKCGINPLTLISAQMYQSGFTNCLELNTWTSETYGEYVAFNMNASPFGGSLNNSTPINNAILNDLDFYFKDDLNKIKAEWNQIGLIIDNIGAKNGNEIGYENCQSKATTNESLIKKLSGDHYNHVRFLMSESVESIESPKRCYQIVSTIREAVIAAFSLSASYSLQEVFTSREELDKFAAKDSYNDEDIALILKGVQYDTVIKPLVEEVSKMSKPAQYALPFLLIINYGNYSSGKGSASTESIVNTIKKIDDFNSVSKDDAEFINMMLRIIKISAITQCKANYDQYKFDQIPGVTDTDKKVYKLIKETDFSSNDSKYDEVYDELNKLQKTQIGSKANFNEKTLGRNFDMYTKDELGDMQYMILFLIATGLDANDKSLFVQNSDQNGIGHAGFGSINNVTKNGATTASNKQNEKDNSHVAVFRFIEEFYFSK